MTLEALAREVLVSLFRLYPGRFVLIGGGALRLLYGSPRSSADLDLVGRRQPSEAELRGLAAALERDLSRLPSLAGRIASCRAARHDVEVRIDGAARLLLQFPRLPAALAKGESRLVTGESLRTEMIVAPPLDALLECKAVALLKRPAVKGRDVFDIWFLRERDARLDEEGFDSWLRWEELDAGDIRSRLGELTPKRLKADLGRYLPEGLAARLEAEAYRPLIEAVRGLFSPWLED